MKRIKIVFAVALAILAGYNVYESQQKVELPDYAMENVEALASGEEISPTVCPGGRHLCVWVQSPMGSVTYYDKNGPDTI